MPQIKIDKNGRLQTLIKSTKGLFMWKKGTKIFDVAISFIKTLDFKKSKLCRFETLGDPCIDLQIYSLIKFDSLRIIPY